MNVIALAWVALLGMSVAKAGALVVNANTSDPAPRAAWEAAVARFERENPDVRVSFNVYDHESYKKSIRNWLTAEPPDVVFWFAGHRMRQFVTPGLLQDVSGLFGSAERMALPRSAIDLVTVGGRQYGGPYTYYAVGLYFRADVLAAAGIVAAPRTFDELVDACVRLRAVGIEPFAIGTRDLWPAAAWFDLIDLRSNGLDFHLRLMDGRVPYTDARVRDVFARWRTLVDLGCFTRNHASSGWQEAQALLHDGRAAMMLIGNYAAANVPAAVIERIDFVAFPDIREGAGRFEDAPMNTIHVPARARNGADAKRFLAFVLRSDVQEEMNRRMLLLPVRQDAAVADERLLRRARAVLERADGFAQYFDRDTSEELANDAL